jgi:hypothetical protein
MLAVEETIAGVQVAVANLVELYRKSDLAGYMACFSPYARIILPSGEGIPAQGFLGGQVTGYASGSEHTYLLSDASAVFSHEITVETEDTSGAQAKHRLFETLVLQKGDEGRWQVVHQHLR